MKSDRVVLEISSDEDGDCHENDGSFSDWLSELLGRDNRESDEAEKSNDVLFVGEVSSILTVEKQKCLPSTAIKDVSGNDSDDDCLVLEADPDQAAPVADDKEDDSDDVLVVSEKGQIACRDYPHSRHLCAKFPFSSTPHEKHCHQCHCYVCDLPAPCIYWATGLSSTDHCHATDKEKIWRDQRECFREGNSGAPPVQLLPVTALTMTLAPCDPDPIVSLPDALSISLVPDQLSLSKSIEFEACSVTHFSKQNITNHRHARRRPLHGRGRCAQHPGQYQLSISGTRRIDGESSSGTGALGLQSVSYPRFKRGGSLGGAFMSTNQSGHGPSNISQMNCTMQQRTQSQAMPRNEIGWKKQNFLEGMELESDTLQDLYSNKNSNFVDLLPIAISSQPQAYSQAPPPSNAMLNNNHFGNSVPNSNLDPSEFNPGLLGDISQHSSNLEPALLSLQPSVLPAAIQANHQHLQTNPGSADCHLDSWVYNLRNQPTENPTDMALFDLDFGLSYPTIAESTSFSYELGSMWAV